MGFYKFGPAGGEVRQKTITAAIDVTIAIFFDGTSNNKTNTDQHNTYIKLTNKQATGAALTTDEQTTLKNNVYKKNTADLSSYENDYSNVVKLYLNYKSNNQYQFAKYIEGIGTDDLKKDDSSGGGWGGGKDGIPVKVEKACDLVAQQLRDIVKVNPNTTIKSLTIDIFGFSRGAAAARNFVYEVTSPEYDAVADSGTVYRHKYGYLGTCFSMYHIQLATPPIIRFVGLFDTVASYAEDIFIPDSLSPDSPATDDTPKQFKNDTDQLHLDAIAEKAIRVIQFTADDEHRGNFPLTTIEKAVFNKRGSTFNLPGVHSDIGGSYTDQITEKNIIILNRPENELIKEKERLKSEEWFKENELKIGLTNLGHGHILHSGNLYSERIVSNKYSFIPLHFMCKSAIDFTKNSTNAIPFNQKGINIENQYSILKDSLLNRIKQRLYKQVFENGAPLIFKYFSEVLKEHHQNYNDKNYSKECNDEIGDQEDLRLLRHKYLHWNANYNESIVVGVGTIHPFYPRLVNGVRIRCEKKG
jgi:hypothetical protein